MDFDCNNLWNRDSVREGVVGRRAFLGAVLGGFCAVGLSGCALVDKFSFKKYKTVEKVEKTEKAADAAKVDKKVFDTESDEQDEMADLVSETGRGGKEKREIPPGETFLLSDKAREIYANTER